jgi:hypothetical protein
VQIYPTLCVVGGLLAFTMRQVLYVVVCRFLDSSGFGPVTFIDAVKPFGSFGGCGVILVLRKVEG